MASDTDRGYWYCMYCERPVFRGPNTLSIKRGDKESPRMHDICALKVLNETRVSIPRSL